MKIHRTVAVGLVAALLLTGCPRSAKEPSAKDPAAGSASPLASAGAPAVAATPTPDRTLTASSAPALPSDPPAAASSVASGGPPHSSAYPGCGEAIPAAQLWDETSEGEVLDAIDRAKRCAAEHGRRLLLEFVAPWCEDCREMAKLEESEVVAVTMKKRFERVRINVGKWDRHEALRNSFDVHALATYIVIDPKTSKPLAKTTLEPITKKGQKLSAEQWAHWLEAH